MNKSLVCLAFCALNSYAMQNPFGDNLNPDKVVEAAASGLFGGPLPAVTQSEMPAHTNDTEFDEAAAAFNKLDPFSPEEPKSSVHLRRTISLNEAIRLAKFKAVEDEEKGKILEFEDFETTEELRLAPFYMSLSDVNTHIYNSVSQARNITENSPIAKARAAKNKILNNPPKPLSEEDYCAYQAPLILGFLTQIELNRARQSAVEQISEDDDLSKNKKRNIIDGIEAEALKAFENRATYFAALASHNIEAINSAKEKSLYPHFMFFSPLMLEIKKLRQQAERRPGAEEFLNILLTATSGHECAHNNHNHSEMGAPGCHTS